MLNISTNSTKKKFDDEKFYIFRTLHTPNPSKLLAKWLVVLSIIFFLFLFLPWQQNIRGKGKVTAFTPENRPQTVESAIAGRISSWNIREGDFVMKGDTLLTLSEVKDKYFDPNLLKRLQEQIDAKDGSIVSKRDKVSALRERIDALITSRDVKMRQARNKLTQAKLKLESDSIDYEAEKIRFKNFENQYHRNKKRYEAGNITLTKFQEIESKYQESRMKRISAENKYFQSEAELENTKVNIAGTRAEYQEKINKAKSELNETAAQLYDSEGSLAKMKNEYANMEIRNEQYQLVAPQEGYVVKTLKAGIGQTIKEGEALVTIMPSNPDLAVEMYVKAMDVPLISKGRKVRIEFDGWPALQFSGWPNVAVGTFGGVVKVVDYVNSQPGEFRILVVPDPNDEAWPEQLRIGSGTKGWVMLDTVPVWYEIWRNLNGFPPSLYQSPPPENNADQKKGK